MTAALSLPWSLGSVERPNGEPVTDTAVIFLADGGMIEVEETEKAGRIANLILAAPAILTALAELLKVHREMQSGGAMPADVGIAFGKAEAAIAAAGVQL
ncbi:MAG: hypothetical protein K2X71_15625 [Methylobacterium sp.]|uniref:hypothetical protein n=1 Tax=Methylobacterium sp. TaxID=409 RepID=UPI00258C8C78|nr:hypothetical protein [Methylobacterium sp.]MBY0297444.1 hypothetical protein [Methylobacterium sp.]